MANRYSGEMPFMVGYSAPSCEKLQHDDDGTSLSLHSDITLLQRIDKMRLSQQVKDIVLSRFKEVPSSIQTDFQDAIDKLSDFDRDKLTPSRYVQSLTDRKTYIESLMRSVDDKKKELEDKAGLSRNSAARKRWQIGRAHV